MKELKIYLFDRFYFLSQSNDSKSFDIINLLLSFGSKCAVFIF